MAQTANQAGDRAKMRGLVSAFVTNRATRVQMENAADFLASLVTKEDLKAELAAFVTKDDLKTELQAMETRLLTRIEQGEARLLQAINGHRP